MSFSEESLPKALALDVQRTILDLMNGAVIKTLREGETAVCDCCGAELTARVIVARAGNFGQSCWKTIKAAASTVRIATKSGNVARVEDVLSRNAKRAEHIKAVAA